MSRYEQVSKHNYDVPLNYSEPVHIAASALLRDTVTLNYFAQIKLKNISEFSIEKVSVIVVPYDANERKIGNEITHTYDRLTVSPNEDFGSKEAIAFTDIKDVSSFQVTVKNVLFTNGLEWKFGQTIEDVKSGKNSEVLKLIETYLGGGNYKKAISLVGDLFDTEDNKTKLINDIYMRCVTIAEGKISGGDNSAAEKALDIVPSGFEGKKDALEHLNAAKRSVYEKEQAHKNKIRKISAIAVAFVIVAVAVSLITTKVIIPNSHYNAAVKLYEEGSYEDAIAEFRALDGYKDSNQQIVKCQEAIQEEENEMTYNEALQCHKNGDIAQAVSLLGEIKEYKDASNLYDKYSAELKAEAVALMGKKIANDVYALEEGDTFEFGKYMQERDSEKKQPIKWIVLEKGDGGYSALLLSEEVLAHMPFNKSAKSGTTWENSSLRKWLNDDFLKSAFSKDEQKMIAKSYVSAEKNNKFPERDAGNDTEDKLYVLSIQEMQTYRPYSNEKGYETWFQPISQTDYSYGVLSNISGNMFHERNEELAPIYEDAEYTAWLRNPGRDENTMTYADSADFDSSFSIIMDYGADAYNEAHGVQPVLRIGLTQ